MSSHQIITRRGDYYGDGSDSHIYEIHDDAGLAAELYVSADHHMIGSIEVREDRRGEGLARAMYELAVTRHPVFHAPVWGCTIEGLAFAQAMGGDVMDDETAAAITGVDLDMVV